MQISRHLALYRLKVLDMAVITLSLLSGHGYKAWFLARILKLAYPFLYSLGILLIQPSDLNRLELVLPFLLLI